MSNPRRIRALAALLTAGALVGLAGCASGDAPDTGSDTGAVLPDEVVIDFMADGTGLSSTFAASTRKGWDLRVAQADANEELGEGIAVSSREVDSQSDPKVAAGVMSELVSSDAIVVGYGTSSSIAPAIVPIAQDGGLPFVAMYAGSPDLTAVGDYIFRVTAPQSTYHDLQSQYFADNDVKTIDIIYDNDIGTLKALAESFYPAAAERDGYEIVRSTGVSVQATDLSAEMSGVISDNPDAVLMLVLSQQNTSIVTQLNRAGYDGIIAAQPGIGRTTLEALGADADGIVYPIDFTAGSDNPLAAEFVAAYTDEYGVAPDSFAAAGYEGASLIIEAIKRATEYTREGVQRALVEVTDEGFSGVTGDIAFEDRDARVPGIMVRWKDGTEEVISD